MEDDFVRTLLAARRGSWRTIRVGLGRKGGLIMPEKKKIKPRKSKEKTRKLRGEESAGERRIFLAVSGKGGGGRVTWETGIKKGVDITSHARGGKRDASKRGLVSRRSSKAKSTGERIFSYREIG